MEVGSKAFNFTLADAHNNLVRLSDFLGKKVILYFYPKDNTPGCSRQACSFKVNYDAFTQKNCVVIGISKDSVNSHRKFIEKYELPFILLSDPSKETIMAYDAWVEKKLYGKLGFGIQRCTYIIDEEGIVEHFIPKAKPDTNASEILAYIQ